MWNHTDEHFLAAVGIQADLPANSPIRRSVHVEHDLYRSVLYWRHEAIRYEKTATYALAAWLLTLCIVCLAGIVWCVHYY
jgi:hypothetical protein